MSKATSPEPSASSKTDADSHVPGNAKPAAAAAGKQAAQGAEPADAQANKSDAQAKEGEAGEARDPRLAELQHALADRDARLEATLGQYKDALDEFGRVKARLTRDVAREVATGKKHFLTQMLEVLDNLERALEVALADPQQAASPLCEGITMVRDQFHAKLLALGVKKLVALGQPFDPLHFEAVSTVPVADKAQDGQVIGVMRDAYLFEQETLRHGIVAVGKHGGDS